MDETKVINGSYGECHCEGKWLTNIYKMSADIEPSYGDVKMSGSRWTGQKLLGLKGSGSISGYKITSELVKNVARITDDRKSEYVTELISKLDDPEAYGYERVRLKHVKFSKIPIVGWEVGSMVEEEWPFTFVGVEWLDKIEES
ncbi:MAG: phage portal protein [Paenibacillaceae bacterium]|nr:phage portal protein [Paenibacillaceae bacterium]